MDSTVEAVTSCRWTNTHHGRVVRQIGDVVLSTASSLFVGSTFARDAIEDAQKHGFVQSKHDVISLIPNLGLSYTVLPDKTILNSSWKPKFHGPNVK